MLHITAITEYVKLELVSLRPYLTNRPVGRLLSDHLKANGRELFPVLVMESDGWFEMRG